MFWIVAALLAGALASAGDVARASSRGAGGATFEGGPMPADPAVHVARNRDYEPGIAVAPDGSIWAVANVQFIYSADDPRDKVISGEDIWRSRDQGRTFQWVADPADLTGSNAQTGPGGGDVDIATATAPNRDGTFNVYAVTGWAGSATLSFSRNSGRTWTTTPVGMPPDIDRPWVVADGPCRFYVAARPLVNPSFEYVLRYDLCQPTGSALGVTASSAGTPAPAGAVQLLEAAGKPAVDTSPASPYQHSVYLAVRGCNPAAGGRGCIGPSSIDIAASRDGGQTFTSHHVSDDGGGDAGLLPMVATDRAGAVYVTWTDWGRVFLAVSTDGGNTWAQRTVDISPTTFGVLPQVAANQPGEVALAWYGVEGGSSDVAVYVARSRDRGASFATVAASPVVHVGPLCSSTQGACPTPNGNDLRDDFGVAIDPWTDAITVAYTSDRPEGDRSHDYVGYATQRPNSG